MLPPYEVVRTSTPVLRRRHPTFFDVKPLRCRGGAVVCPGGVFVVDGVGFQAAVEDADEAVGELA